MFNKKNLLTKTEDDLIYIEQTINYYGFGEHGAVFIDPYSCQTYLPINSTDNILYISDSNELATTHLGLYSEPLGAWEPDIAYFTLNLPVAINGDIDNTGENITLIDSSEYDWCLITTDNLENPTITYKVFGSDIKSKSNITYKFNIYEKDKKYAVVININGSDVCFYEVYGTSENVQYLTFIVAHKDIINTLR